MLLPPLGLTYLLSLSASRLRGQWPLRCVSSCTCLPSDRLYLGRDKRMSWYMFYMFYNRENTGPRVFLFAFLSYHQVDMSPAHMHCFPRTCLQLTRTALPASLSCLSDEEPQFFSPCCGQGCGGGSRIFCLGFPCYASGSNTHPCYLMLLFVGDLVPYTGTVQRRSGGA